MNVAIESIIQKSRVAASRVATFVVGNLFISQCTTLCSVLL